MKSINIYIYNNNNEYLERLTHTGPKRLHVLYKYILSKFNVYNMNAHTHTYAHTDSHTHTRARTHAHTQIFLENLSRSENLFSSLIALIHNSRISGQ